METRTYHYPPPLIAAEPDNFAHSRRAHRNHRAQGQGPAAAVEKMITLGKRGDLSARRQAAAYLMTSAAVDKLFDTIGPRFGDREGGYLRIVRLGWRKGDGADTAFVELLGSEKAAGRKARKTRRGSCQARRRSQESHGRSRSPAGRRAIPQTRRWRRNRKKQEKKKNSVSRGSDCRGRAMRPSSLFLSKSVSPNPFFQIASANLCHQSSSSKRTCFL